MEYKPGDVANGHMLGADGVWHPVGAQPQQQYMKLDPNNYWAKYLRRWIWTVLAVSGVLFVGAMFDGGFMNGGASAIGVVSFLCFGIPAGSVLNFLVAVFPSSSAGGR